MEDKKRFLQAWERNGTRRPLPSLYEACQKYGYENVYFDQPKFVEDGYCKWCGEKITNKRRKEFCSTDCSNNWGRSVVWGRGRGAYSMRILYRDGFTCQDCGTFLAVKNVHGVYLPIDCGAEVHHIVPVSEGGGDEQTNLVTLCKECHLKRHQELRKEKK